MSKSSASVRLRALVWIVLFFTGVFLALQFVRPTLTNPSVVADLQAPPDVKTILQTSCYNCHSNETKVPWFDKIVPAYWLVVHDVRHGRAHLNFSTFGNFEASKQKAFLYEAVNQIQLGAMPPANYLLIHPNAKVSPDQLAVLKNYLHPASVKTLDPGEARDHEKAREIAGEAAYAQYQQWIASAGSPPPQVKPAPNGLAFFPDYKNWKPISTTDRFDNDTFRVILGNDIAQSAIAANNIHPWPDGAAFAKIAWKQHEIQNGPLLPGNPATPDMIGDDKEITGTTQSGEFVQVEFMTKDAKKYASTEGWGFGRWKGLDLKPYGKDANFTMECASCHRPMQANDFVYTMPIHDAPMPTDLLNRDAALSAHLPHQPFQWRVITSFSNTKDSTMSTLYGNDSAVDHAQSSPHPPYPLGAVLALVTWNQQEDRHWFGGRIPDRPLSVEYVSWVPSVGLIPGFMYEIYKGDSLKKENTDDLASVPRVLQISALRAAVMP